MNPNPRQEQAKRKPTGLIIVGIFFAVLSIVAYAFQSLIDFQALLLLMPISAILLIVSCLSKTHKTQYVLLIIILAFFMIAYLLLGNLKFPTIFGAGGARLNIYFIIVVLVLALLNGIALLIHLLKKRMTVVLIIEALLTLALSLPMFLFARTSAWGVLFISIFITKLCAALVYNRTRLAATPIEPMTPIVTQQAQVSAPVPPEIPSVHSYPQQPQVSPVAEVAQPEPAEPVVKNHQSRLSDRLQELKALYSQGLIDEREYEELRQRLLREL